MRDELVSRSASALLTRSGTGLSYSKATRKAVRTSIGPPAEPRPD